MTEKNVPLLLATMALIKLYPEKHDQTTWADVNPCNTTMCYAGHAAVISGATFDPKIFLEEDQWVVDADGKHVSEETAEDNVFNLKQGYKYVENFAADKLGLNPVEASYLFYHGRTREQLEYAVAKFAEGYTVDSINGSFYKEETPNAE